MDYTTIYDFCKVRNTGTVFSNSPDEPTPRVKFLMDLLDKEGIEYELDKSFYTRPSYTSFFSNVKRKNNLRWNRGSKLEHNGFDDDFDDDFDDFGDDSLDNLKEVPDEKPKDNGTPIYNIILKGSSNRMVVAHHDINNPNIDNANDNSCSVINCLMIKKLMPTMNVVILDGEEFGGLGAQRVSEQIKAGYFGNIQWVLNLELTGKGGNNFFVGSCESKLADTIISLFDCPVVFTPFNDSVIFRKNGIDSCVINPLPILPEGEISSVEYKGKYLDYNMLFNCHSPKDTVSSIDPADMKEFVEEIVIKILKS